MEINSIYGFVTVEMCGGVGEFNVLAKSESVQPLFVQIILKQLDLRIDSSKKKVILNPGTPELPMVKVLMAMPLNSGFAVCFAHTNPSLRSELLIPTRYYV